MNIQFLYATETGTSEMLCEDMVDALSGFECTITNLGEFDPADFDAATFYVFVVSTYGNGDIPATALPFWDAIEASPPNLTNIRFAIFGLGDMVFAETFNNGSKQVADKLVGLGAQMIGERGLYDASTVSLPEDTGVPWLTGLLPMLEDAAA